MKNESAKIDNADLEAAVAAAEKTESKKSKRTSAKKSASVSKSESKTVEAKDTTTKTLSSEFSEVKINKLDASSLPSAIDNSLKKVQAWRTHNANVGKRITDGLNREQALTRAKEFNNAREFLIACAGDNAQLLAYIANPNNAKTLKDAVNIAEALQGRGRLCANAKHAYNGMKRASQALDSATIANMTGNSGSLSAIRNALRAFAWIGLAEANGNTNCLVQSFRGVSFTLTESGKEQLSKLV